MSASEASAQPRRGWSRLPGWARLFIVLALFVIALPCTLTTVAFRSWEQTGPSMAPNLPDGTGLFASRFGEPAPGDVVVFESPQDRFAVIKRVIAVGGQSVEVVDGVPHVDGEPLERQRVVEAVPESSGYVCHVEKIGEFAWLILENEDLPPASHPEVTVPPGHIFVLGDNRSRSNDSRVFGPVHTDAVKGLMSWVYRPGMEADTPRCLPPGRQ